MVLEVGVISGLGELPASSLPRVGVVTISSTPSDLFFQVFAAGAERFRSWTQLWTQTPGYNKVLDGTEYDKRRRKAWFYGQRNYYVVQNGMVLSMNIIACRRLHPIPPPPAGEG